MDSRGVLVRALDRLRRSLLRLLAWIVGRRRLRLEEYDALSFLDEGPPQDWLERVRRGAPGLLEPSVHAHVQAVTEASSPVAPPERVGLSEPLPPRAVGKRPARRGVPARSPFSRSPVEAPDASRAPERPTPVEQPTVVESPASQAMWSEQLALREPVVAPRPSDYGAARPEPESVLLELPAATEVEGLRPTSAPRLRPTTARRRSALELIRPVLSAHRRSNGAEQGGSIRVPPANQAPSRTRPEEPIRRAAPPARSAPATAYASPEPHPWPTLPAPRDALAGDADAATRLWARERRLEREQMSL
jgi:hypothetical protein